LISKSTMELVSSSDPSNHNYATSDNLVRISVQMLPLPFSNEFLSPHTAAKAHITYNSPVPIRIGRIHIAAYKTDHTLCCVVDSAAACPGLDPDELELIGTGSIEVIFEPLQLTPGKYYVIVRVTDLNDVEIIASCQSSVFSVVADTVGDHSGVFVPNTNWRIQAGSASEPIDAMSLT
jgi:hypothetical protein